MNRINNLKFEHSYLHTYSQHLDKYTYIFCRKLHNFAVIANCITVGNARKNYKCACNNTFFFVSLNARCGAI